MTFAISDMESTKRYGPIAEPWGTPVSLVVEGEDDESIFTNDEISVSYERIREKT